MRIVVLASGSKGNCTFVEEGDTRILIDLGMSCDYVEKQLQEIKVEPSTIQAVLITHTHSDHISGLVKFNKKYKPLIYITSKMIGVLKEYLNDFNYEQYSKEKTIIDTFQIDTIKTSHDVSDSVGFIINNKAVYITDTGYLNAKYFPLLQDKEVYIIESNHDVEMLIDGKYPYHIKQRILGDRGHLSNKSTAQYLSKLVGDRTKVIVLAHLSEENNKPEAALETLLACIAENKIEKIIVADQHKRTELIEI